MGMNLKSRAISAINKNGILLVYPLNNQEDPPSIWQALYPRSKMRWEWTDDTGDDRVAEIWHLRMELSTSKKVVYAKWFQGRATFFSRDYFISLLSVMNQTKIPLSRDARNLLALMQESSPLSTKELKLGAQLQGKLLESTYNKAMKELWRRLLIVGFGEVDDGAFPSLAVGASSLLFEDLYHEALELPPHSAQEKLKIASPKFSKFLEREKKSLGIF